MARPGFVLTVDERTPPLVVPDGDNLRLERFPLGTKVVYPGDSPAPVPDIREAVDAALDAPLDSDPLSTRLGPQTRLTLCFDDVSVPVPQMRTPDLRGIVLEAVLTRAAAAGVDDVALVTATGLNRRLTVAELQRLTGERVFRSFYADGRLTNHDAEDPDGLTTLGETAKGPVAVNARVAASDLVVYVHLVDSPRQGVGESFVTGLGSAATIGQLRGFPAADDTATVASAVWSAVKDAVPVFEVDLVLDHGALPPALDFLTQREWEWSVRDRATWFGVRRGLALTPPRTRRRLLQALQAGYRATQVSAGAPSAVHATSQAQILAQQVVSVGGQADVGVIGVGRETPYSVGSVTNPILAAWAGLVGGFGATTGRRFVREGGALILYHPMVADFSPLHHPSYVDFFTDVLVSTTDPAQISADVEPKYSTDPWYSHLYRTSHAFAGVHPLHRWYELSAARAHLSDVVWVGADRTTVERLGFRAASTLADALEIVASSVGHSPQVSFLHAPPGVVVDVT